MGQQKIYCIIRLVLLLIVFSFGIWLAWSNFAIEKTHYRIMCERIPQSFHGFMIAQVSDLHNTEFGKDNRNLVKKLTEAEPDIIVITGDMIDSRRTDLQTVLDFAKKIVEICPVYYVNGNHESRISEYEMLKTGLEACGVIVLENRKVELVRNSDTITLLGVSDPAFYRDSLAGDSKTLMKTVLSQLQQDRDGYTVLLSHRPELFEVYADTGIDLVFSGHTHGGQFRLPFIGGLVAPDQGFFPEYDSGLFTEENTAMIISRGLGASVIPIRFYNRPEIVLAELASCK